MSPTAGQGGASTGRFVVRRAGDRPGRRPLATGRPDVSWSQGEAYLPAQHPATCPQARIQASNVDARGSLDHQVPPPAGPSAAVGLKPVSRIVPTHCVGANRCFSGSHDAPSSVGSLPRHSDTVQVLSLSWRSIALPTRVQGRVWRWLSAVGSAPPCTGTGCAARSVRSCRSSMPSIPFRAVGTS